MIKKWLRWYPWNGTDASEMAAELRDSAVRSKERGDGGWCLCGDRLVVVSRDDYGRLEAYECKILRTSKARS